MATIDGDTNISTLSIPGTHNSAAFFKLAAPSVRCQGNSIYDQLNNGVRFLDIRLSKDYMSRGEKVNNLIVVHGKFPVKLSGSYKFKNVLKDVYSFLETNPTETVLISIKFENTMLNWNQNNDEFAKILFQKYIGHNRNRWYLSDKIPTLKYARGKAILLRRFPVIPNGTYKKFGIPSLWNFENPVYNDNLICVQDYNDIKSSKDLNKKMDLIKDTILKANDYHGQSHTISSTRKNSNVTNKSNSSSPPSSHSSNSFNSFNSSLNNNGYPSDQHSVISASSSNSSYFKSTREVQPKLFINFCSAANYFHKNFWPSNVDKAIRKSNIDDYYTKNSGILVLDFADRDDWKLVKNLVNTNF
jgi:1-phosphatidylinositol phosphodiesterase